MTRSAFLTAVELSLAYAKARVLRVRSSDDIGQDALDICLFLSRSSLLSYACDGLLDDRQSGPGGQ